MPPDTSNSLINLGELSKPANTLIKKASNAVGGIFAPWQIKRVAKAEAEAALTKALTEFEIRRVANRWIEEEARHQKNMEDITVKAFPELNEDAKPDSIENDWLVNFFDKCRIVSDDEMQDLWSRVLAGEANNPGHYSKRTINSLSSLDKTEAELFTKLCGFVWMIEEDPVPLIFGKSDYSDIFEKVIVFDRRFSPVKNFENIYNKNNINFDNLIHLDSIGMIQFDGFKPVVKFNISEKLTTIYYGKSLIWEIPVSDGSRIGTYFGEARLTNIGKQLRSICKSEPVEGFYEYVKDRRKWFLI